MLLPGNLDLLSQTLGGPVVPLVCGISTSLHRKLQSIRFILAAFGLAPVAGMNALTKLLPITCDTAGYEKPENPCGEQRLETYPPNQCDATNPRGLKGFLVTKQEQ